MKISKFVKSMHMLINEVVKKDIEYPEIISALKVMKIKLVNNVLEIAEANASENI